MTYSVRKKGDTEYCIQDKVILETSKYVTWLITSDPSEINSMAILDPKD